MAWSPHTLAELWAAVYLYCRALGHGAEQEFGLLAVSIGAGINPQVNLGYDRFSTEGAY